MDLDIFFLVANLYHLNSILIVQTERFNFSCGDLRYKLSVAVVCAVFFIVVSTIKTHSVQSVKFLLSASFLFSSLIYIT